MPSDPVQEAELSAPSRRGDWLFALMLLAATLAAYYPAWFGTPIWDDEAHMTAPRLRSLSGLWKIWTQPGATQQYYPLVHSFFWLEQKIWGNATLGYHLVNILLHAVCALLLWRILRFLGIPGARLAAAVFALHPIEVESVAWISELKNTLSGAFYLGAGLAYLRFDRDRARRFYLTALALFFLGLFCKTVIATLPAALLVVFWWKRGGLSWKKDAFPLAPLFSLGIAMGLLTAFIEKRYVIGGDIVEFHFTALQRCLIAGRAFWFYIIKLLWPAKLIFIYPRWDVNGSVWWQYLFPVAALALLAALWMLRKRTGTPLAAVLFYGGTLFPALGFVNVYPFIYSFVADHFQYLAGIGVITLVCAGAALLSERMRGGQKTVSHGAAVAGLFFLAALTWRQCGMYAGADVLYSTTLKKNPDCWLAWNNLGNELLSMGQVDDAITHYQKALALNPDYAKEENNLGTALYAKRDIHGATTHFEKAIALRPDLPDANNSLGNLRLKEGKVDEAVAYYRKALQTQPDYAPAYNGLGDAFYQNEDLDNALANYRKALEIQPDMVIALNNTANVLLRKKQTAEAISYYQKALEIAPDNINVLSNLAWSLATSGASVRNGPRAVELAEKANRLSGGESAGILGTLAAAYAEVGRFQDAVNAGEHALRLATEAHNSSQAEFLNTELRYFRKGVAFHQSSP